MHSKLSSSSITPHRELRIAHWVKNSNLIQKLSHISRNSLPQDRIFIKKSTFLKSHFLTKLAFLTKNHISKAILSQKIAFLNKIHFLKIEFSTKITFSKLHF